MQSAPPPSARPEQPYDAADEKQEEKTRTANAIRDERLRSVERALLSTVAGREWVWAVLNGDCHVWEKKIGATPGATEFFAGEREIGLRLLHRLAQASPTDFANMFVENDR